MQVRYEKHWSGHLNRFMEYKIYGHSGRPVLFVPCQAGRFWDFEGFNMDKTWAPWIESGEVMVFACDPSTMRPGLLWALTSAGESRITRSGSATSPPSWSPPSTTTPAATTS